MYLFWLSSPSLLLDYITPVHAYSAWVLHRCALFLGLGSLCTFAVWAGTSEVQ